MDHVTMHSLRRTYVSLLLEAGATVPYVMNQAGHRNPDVTLSIYAAVIERKRDSGARMDALIKGADWAEKASDWALTGTGQAADENALPL